jgi:dihydroorotase
MGRLRPPTSYAVARTIGSRGCGGGWNAAHEALREGTFEFLDNYKGTRAGRQRLFPAGTVVERKIVRRA